MASSGTKSPIAGGMALIAPIFEESHKIPMKELSVYGSKGDKLGEGAYGAVYKFSKGDDVYAVKRMETDDASAGDALREIGYMLRLNHPNVLNIIDVIVRTETTYVVLPFAAKGTLKDINKQLPFQMRKNYAYQFLCGVAYCLSRNVIHCDLKPQNVLVLADDTIKIADFGLAHAFTCEGKYAPTIAYTLWYRAPEVFLGGRYSDSSDIWAAACTVSEIFSKPGHALFKSNEYGDSRQLAVVMSYFKDYETLWPGIKSLPDYGKLEPRAKSHTLKSRLNYIGIDDPQLIEILESMLQLNPERRYFIHAVLRHSFFDDVRKPQNESAEYTCEENLDMRSRYPSETVRSDLVTPKMRRILFDWMYDVKEEYHLYGRTLCLAYYFTDLYTEKKPILRKDYQLLGTVCLFIASEYWESSPPLIEDYIYIMDYSYTKKEFLDMLLKIIEAIRYDGLIATAADYFVLFESAYPENVKKIAQRLISIAYLENIPFHHHGKQIALACFLIACSFFDLQFKHTSKLDRDIITIYERIMKEVETKEGKNQLGESRQNQLIEKIRNNPIKVL